MRKTYRELRVWQKSIDLVDLIYDITEIFPKNETYGLTNQLRRAAVSIPSNIAEGSSRSGAKEFSHFINIAKGSLAEVETQIYISMRRGYLSKDEYYKLEKLLDDVDKMLFGLRNKITVNGKRSTDYGKRSTDYGKRITC